MVRNFLLSILYLLLILGIGFVVLRYVLPLMWPFVLGMVLALLIDPPVNWLERRTRLSRGGAVLLVMGAVLGLGAVILGFGLSRLITELVELTQALPDLYRVAESWSQDALARAEAWLATLPPSMQQVIESQQYEAYASLMSFVRSTLEGVMNSFSHLPSVVVALLVGCLATYFLSRDRRQIGAFLLTFCPASWRGRLADVEGQLLISTVGFIKAQLTMVVFTAMCTTLGLLCLGTDYAVILGIAAGVLDLVPYLGPTAVLGPYIIAAAATSRLWLAVRLAVLLVLLAGLRQVMEVKIVGERIGVHPLATLFALYLGVQFFGPVGFIVGPLAAIILKAVVRAGVLPGYPGSAACARDRTGAAKGGESG